MPNRMLKFLTTSASAAGIGAAAMFFLDPDRGNRRRALVRDKTAGAATRTGRLFRKASRDLEHRAEGAIAEARSRLKPEWVDDAVLVERIRSKMGRAVSHPGAIDVSVSSGCATLRGDVLQSELSDLMSTLYSLPGVRHVRNKLRAHSNDTTFSTLQGGRRDHHANHTPRVRLAVGATGGAMAVYGMKRRGTLGKVLGTVGASLLGSEVANTGFSRLAR